MTTQTEDRLANAKAQAGAQFESIREMLEDLSLAREAGTKGFDPEEHEDAIRRLFEEDGHAEIVIYEGECYWHLKTNTAPIDRENDVGYDTEAEAMFDYLDSAGLVPDEDEARQRIEDDPLSVQVRSGWHSVGELAEDEEFEILLCTGGPAVRIVGELDRGTPTRCWMECQDWFTPWTEVIYYTEDKRIDNDMLLEYAQQCCFEC